MSGPPPRPAPGPPTDYEVLVQCPEFLVYHRPGFRLPVLATLARQLFGLARRVGGSALPGAGALAEALAVAGDELGEVLRACSPVRVCAAFARDSPLRRLPGREP